MGTLHEGLFTFMMMSCQLRLKVRSVSHRGCKGNKNTFYV